MGGTVGCPAGFRCLEWLVTRSVANRHAIFQMRDFSWKNCLMHGFMPEIKIYIHTYILLANCSKHKII